MMLTWRVGLAQGVGVKEEGKLPITEEQWVSMWLAVVDCLSADQRDLLVEGFLLLLHRNWFKRVWIIQEIANAQAAKIVCGSNSISASTSLLGITPDPHCQPIALPTYRTANLS
jgi:hypothetical protein